MLRGHCKCFPVGLRTSEEPMGDDQSKDNRYLLMNCQFSDKFNTHSGKTRCISPWDIWVAITETVSTREKSKLKIIIIFLNGKQNNIKHLLINSLLLWKKCTEKKSEKYM